MTDVESETQISQTLRRLGVPVLRITNRPETQASADRVYSLADGYLTALNHQRAVDDGDRVRDPDDDDWSNITLNVQ